MQETKQKEIRKSFLQKAFDDGYLTAIGANEIADWWLSEFSTLLAERDAEVLKKMDEYEYHKDEIHCTCLGSLREFITNKLDGK